MIKRRFYQFEHGDKDAPSASSSSDSEVEVGVMNETEGGVGEEEEEIEDVDVDEEEEIEEQELWVVRNYEEVSSSSGYESEDCSLNEANLDFPGLPTSDEDITSRKSKLNVSGKSSRGNNSSSLANTKHDPEKDAISYDASDYVLKCKSVFKCRICPRIVCLSEETLRGHLNSKRHARSEKLLREGRLKLMLNEKGQIEGETEPEKPYTTPVYVQHSAKKKGNETFNQKKRSRQPFVKPGKKGNETFNQKRTRQNRADLIIITLITTFFCQALKERDHDIQSKENQIGRNIALES